MRTTSTCVVLLVTLLAGPAAGQSLVQTDWTGGPGVTGSTDLATEDAFDSSSGHALHGTVPGAVRVVQFLYTDVTDTYEVMPVRVDETAENYYDYSPYSNPQGPDTGTFKVMRGGSWDNNWIYARIAYRTCPYVGARHSAYGFRCAVSAGE